MSDSLTNKKHGIIRESKGMRPLSECNTNRSKTPTELLMEFLTCVMTKDYEQALIYCTKILKHEPDNCTALEFYPLILEKLEMMKHEEDSTSESSLSSSSSSSSENILFSHETIPRAFTHDKKEKNPSSEHAVAANKINVPCSRPLVKEIVDESTKLQNSSISLQTRRKKIVETLPSELNTKMAKDKASFPSPLLIHPTKTVTIIGNNATDKTTTEPTKSKKEQAPTVPEGKSPPSTVSLHTSRTITFPKKHTLRNLPRIGNLK